MNMKLIKQHFLAANDEINDKWLSLTDCPVAKLASFEFYKINAVKIEFIPQSSTASQSVIQNLPTRDNTGTVLRIVIQDLWVLFSQNVTSSIVTTEHMMKNSRVRRVGMNRYKKFYFKLKTNFVTNVGGVADVNIMGRRCPWVQTEDLNARFGKYKTYLHAPVASAQSDEYVVCRPSYFIRETYYIQARSIKP